MFRATLTVARRVPKEGATSESKAGVVKLKTKSTLYSARSRDCGGTEREVRPRRPWGWCCHRNRNTQSLITLFIWRNRSTVIISQVSGEQLEQSSVLHSTAWSDSIALLSQLPSLAHQSTGCTQRHRRTFPTQQLAAGHCQNQGLNLPFLNLETRYWVTPPWEDDKRIFPVEWYTEGTTQLGYCLLQ